MASPNTRQLSQNNGRLLLAKNTYQKNQILSQRKVAIAYDVSRSTLQSRIQGRQPRAESNAKKRKLLPTEETALVDWILDLDQRGFPPQLIDVRGMANTLLAARGQNPPPEPVGKNWVDRFIADQSRLKTQWNRKFHAQRAKCEDPVVINTWFQLVQRTRLRHGISDEDTYNFDETGFMMGLIATTKVVTSSDTIGRATAIQPGNREWVTVIEGINATGWAIPPFIILPGRVHQSNWYKDLSPDWVIALSDNDWTNNQLSLEWVKHFNTHTETRTKGTHRLLILDGHGSHATPEFDQYCKANQIITLCMPAHTSHLLQPLDVSCFSPLKHSYGLEVQDLVRCGIQHIDKDDFLEIYRKIRPIALTKDNIQSGFRATGLIPYAPERVLSSLTITKPPTPPGTADGEITQWISETPHNLVELEHQSRLIRGLLQRQSQSPSNQAISQLIKGCQMAMHSAVILTKENTQLRLANERRQRKQQHRRRYLANGGVLQAQQGQFLLDRVENGSQEASNNGQVGARKRAPPTCSNCYVQGHNRLRCPNS
jgi:hypothetical protein